MKEMLYAVRCLKSNEDMILARIQGGIGFGCASHWLKNWHESFEPITKLSNCNLVITFDSHLKTALSFH